MYKDLKWQGDAGCVLPRGVPGEFDSKLVGDPCIVWDEEFGAWRMFYFCADGASGRCATALSRSAEDIAPGDWTKDGLLLVSTIANFACVTAWYKWWVVMDARRPNHAARIDGRYWVLVVVGRRDNKVFQAAHAERLAGPWHVIPRPILTPGPADSVDARRCDSPTAYWFPERDEVLIFYKAHPRTPQADQPGSPFASSSMAATWRPGLDAATKHSPVLRPGQNGSWAAGWIGSLQLLPDEKGGWHALLTAGPTPRAQHNRPPSPVVLGGWASCSDEYPISPWTVDTERSPLRRPEDITPQETAAGIDAHSWRHYLLVTPKGRARIFYNSGPRGGEQIYSLVGAPA